MNTPGIYYDVCYGLQTPRWIAALPYFLFIAIPVVLALIILGIIFAVEKRKRK